VHVLCAKSRAIVCELKAEIAAAQAIKVQTNTNESNTHENNPSNLRNHSIVIVISGHQPCCTIF
jgi:hypothetical protein